MIHLPRTLLARRLDGLGEIQLLNEDRSLQHDVYAVIIEWIHQGLLRSGDRVSEAAIARHLGVSRGPVREAISRLDNEGLLVRRPRRGAIVTEFALKDLEDIASMRQLIEGHAARTACQLITSSDSESLGELIAAMKVAAEAGQWTETVMLNGQFHSFVLGISGNKILAKIWQTLHPLAWMLAPVASPHTAHDPYSMVLRHQALVDALNSGDPDHAEQAFRLHVLESSQMTLDQMTANDAARSANDLTSSQPNIGRTTNGLHAVAGGQLIRTGERRP